MNTNIETDFFASNYSPLPTHIVWKVCNYLFVDAHNSVTPELFEYIRHHYMRMGSCVLWKRSAEFFNLCKVAGLDSELGEQEVIITRSGEILYSNDYHIKPVPLN